MKKIENIKYYAIACYLLSLLMPVNLSDPHLGVQLLLQGWLGFAENINLGVAWLANITFLTVIFIKDDIAHTAIAVLTFAFALFVIRLKIPGIGYVGLGYYIWLLSFIIMLVYSVLRWSYQEKSV